MTRPFQVHPRLTEQGLEHALRIELAFDECANKVRDLCINGREMALVQTHLQTAAMFAFRAMLETPGNTQE